MPTQGAGGGHAPVTPGLPHLTPAAAAVLPQPVTPPSVLAAAAAMHGLQLSPQTPGLPPMPSTPQESAPPGQRVLGIAPEQPRGRPAGSPAQTKRRRHTHRSRAADPVKERERSRRRHPYAVMATLEGLLQAAKDDLESCRDETRTGSLEAEVFAIAERLQEVRAEAEQRWGNRYAYLAAEDYRASFGEELPDTIAEEGEEDEDCADDAVSLTSTESVPDVPLDALASGVEAGGHAAPARPTTGGATGTTLVELSMTLSPTSIARSADLDADTRLGAVPGPEFIGTSPELTPMCQPRIGAGAAPVAATPGTPAATATQSTLPPALAPLVSGTTEASYTIVASADPGAMPSVVPSPSATPMASFQSMATGTASAEPPGGGDAPEDATAGTDAGAPIGVGGLAAARAAAILAAASQIPGAEGTIVGDIIVISDLASLLPVSTLMAILFCIATMMSAFAAGWWFRGECDARAKWATLRPDTPSAASSAPYPPAAYPPIIYTTRTGKFWHLNSGCQSLEPSRSTFERGACPKCACTELRCRPPQVAATPRGSD